MSEFEWFFPGGDPAVSNEENPLVTYSQPGVYDVTLTVTNSLGDNTLTKPGLVVVEETPEADFFFEIDSLTVTFTNLSSGGTYFVWNFGDGNVSDLENPVHTYDGNGVYTVNLTAGNTACGSAIAYQVFINTTDTDEQILLPSAMIYPNPAGEFLFLKLAELPPGRVEGSLWSAQGKLVKTFDIDNLVTPVSTGNLTAGFYLLELRAGQQAVRFKFIKR